jgi:hypothetical protein
MRPLSIGIPVIEFDELINAEDHDTIRALKKMQAGDENVRDVITVLAYIGKLQKALRSRDDFLVNNDLFMAYVDTLD